jgi:hypothetical protein
MSKIRIAVPQERVTPDHARMREAARLVLDGEGVREYEVTLAFVDDATIHQRNKQFLDHEDPGMLAELAVIDRFHVGRLARFLTLLKSTQEAGDSMLDRTMVLFGSGMNSGLGGEHSPKNLPTLEAGGAKLGLKHAGHLAFKVEKHPPLANVLLTLGRNMGVEM